MQGSFSFYRKRAGNFLPEKYAAAAALRDLPLEKRSFAGKFGGAFSDYLRPLRQTRPRPVSTESRAFRVVQRMSSGK
jgi:hypothetical protein